MPSVASHFLNNHVRWITLWFGIQTILMCLYEPCDWGGSICCSLSFKAISPLHYMFHMYEDWSPGPSEYINMSLKHTSGPRPCPCGVLGMVAFKQPMCRWYRKNSADTDLVEHRSILLVTRPVSELQNEASNLERSLKPKSLCHLSLTGGASPLI